LRANTERGLEKIPLSGLLRASVLAQNKKQEKTKNNRFCYKTTDGRSGFLIGSGRFFCLTVFLAAIFLSDLPLCAL
jgi:hypothetical protein